MAKVVSRFRAGLLILVLVMPATWAALPETDGNGNTMPSLAPMLAQTMPGVVNIATRSQIRVQDNPMLQDPFFRWFFGAPSRPRQRETQSLGSGVIIDAKQGYVLTNNHVVDKASEITVTLKDGRHLNAKLIGADRAADVAVIQIPPDDLVAVKIADSSVLRVGDFVVAIGNPFGLNQTATSGIVSALGRSGLGIEGYEDFIQTDASINPGNSGGALVNLKGELVGINTAILAPGGGNVGIGFAIPSNMAMELMHQLVEYGEVRRGLLGITAQDLTPDLSLAFGLPQDSHGAVIVKVTDDTPAAMAGIRGGDIITALNGDEIRGSTELRNKIGLLRVGEKISLEIERDGRSLTLTTEIAEPVVDKVGGGKLDPRLAGAEFSDIEQGAELSKEDVQGVVITSVEARSPAASAGLRPGDIITSVNRRPVKNLSEIKATFRKRSDSLLINIRRGNMALFVLLR